jgi:hypothetical protein
MNYLQNLTQLYCYSTATPLIIFSVVFCNPLKTDDHQHYVYSSISCLTHNAVPVHFKTNQLMLFGKIGVSSEDHSTTQKYTA